MTSEVRVPTLGESVTEATVATWFKKPGDTVAVDEMLCELETDKVTVEVPSPVAGTLSEIVAQEGETVGVDALLANVSEGDSGSAAAPKAKEAAEDDEAVSQSDRGGDAPKAIDAGSADVAARKAKPSRSKYPHWASRSQKQPSALGSKRSATRSKPMKCFASWKPTRSASKSPRLPLACWPKSSQRKAAQLKPLPLWPS
jgi:pyruvate/2-oxoglutarate dehydrogenase complex dihydrolipoamide acyltransferase (E2) component